MAVIPAGRRPLLVTADAAVLDAVLQLAAALGTDLHVVPDLDAARPVWGAAPVVLVGAEVVAALSRSGLTTPRSLAVVALAGTADLPSPEPRFVRFVLPGDSAGLTAFLDTAGRRPARLVSVLGGRGGAGASTFAAALAVTAAGTGTPTMLVDADPYGGGLDLVLGAEQQDGLRWSDLAALHGPVASAVLVDTLPRAHGVTLLSYGRGGEPGASVAAVEAVLAAGLRAHDLVVADVARHPDPSREAVLRASVLTLVVVPAEVRAIAATRGVLAHLGGAVPDLRVVVRGPAPSGLDARTVARLLGVPCAGWLRAEPGLTATLERGDPPARHGRGPLAVLCRRLLNEVAAEASAA